MLKIDESENYNMAMISKKLTELASKRTIQPCILGIPRQKLCVE
jgi:hypothetical protein